MSGWLGVASISLWPLLHSWHTLKAQLWNGGK